MSDFGTSTLANFVAGWTFAEGGEMLNVVFISCADPKFPDMPATARPCTARERVWLAPFVEAARSPWTLFDMRPLRDLAVARDNGPAVPWQLQEVIMGYDAVLLLKTHTVARPNPFLTNGLGSRTNGRRVGASLRPGRPAPPGRWLGLSPLRSLFQHGDPDTGHRARCGGRARSHAYV